MGRSGNQGLSIPGKQHVAVAPFGQGVLLKPVGVPTRLPCHFPITPLPLDVHVSVTLWSPPLQSPGAEQGMDF